MAPRRINQGPLGVPDGGTLRLPPRGKDGYVESEHPAGREGPSKDLSGALVQVAHRLRRAKNKGSWIMLQPSTVNGTELGA